MAKFNVDEKIRVKLSGRTGVIKTVFQSGYWNMTDDIYSVELDDGSGTVTLDDSALESNEPTLVCVCGAKSTRNPTHHARWCDLYAKDNE